MYTNARGMVTTGSGKAKQEISFDFDNLAITPDHPANELVEWFAERFGYARIVKILNTKSERDAGNLARTKKRIKPEQKLVHAMAWGYKNALDEVLEKMSEDLTVEQLNEYWLHNVWPRSAADYQG